MFRILILGLSRPGIRGPSFCVGEGGVISPYYNRNPDTTTRSPILQPEKVDPTTTGQLYAEKGSLLLLERSSLFSIGLCE